MSWRFITCTGLFVTCLLTANVIAAKLVVVGGLTLTAGIVIFPISYVLGDVLTEVWGYAATRRVIWLGFACNALMVLAIWLGGELPAAPFWRGEPAYQEILGHTPRILVASFVAYLIGEFANAFVLAKLKIATQGRWLWMRTIGSTVVGQALDSVGLRHAGLRGNRPRRRAGGDRGRPVARQGRLRGRRHPADLRGGGVVEIARAGGYVRLRYRLQSCPPQRITVMEKFRGVDYYGLETLLSEDERMIRDAVRDWVEAEFVPIVAEHHRAGTFPVSLIPKLGELGVFGATLKGYGCAGLNNVAYGLIMQELERGDSGLRSAASVQSGLVMYPIYAYGSDAQKEQWLPGLQSGEKVGCFGLTEPDHGSDPGGMKTRARKVERRLCAQRDQAVDHQRIDRRRRGRLGQGGRR